jgi:ribonuclease BN (tRNA processing enzyme)
LVYLGDTGPDDAAVEFARGADLLLVEAALRSAEDDDPVRGHLTVDEAIDLARRAEARTALIVHYDPDRQAEIEARCDEAGPWIRPAYAGLAVALVPATGDEPVLALAPEAGS